MPTVLLIKNFLGRDEVVSNYKNINTWKEYKERKNLQKKDLFFHSISLICQQTFCKTTKKEEGKEKLDYFLVSWSLPPSVYLLVLRKKIE